MLANWRLGDFQLLMTLVLQQDSRPSALASGIDGLSKLASSLLPFARDMVGEFPGREAVVGLTDEVVAFANNIAMHPETWLDFPLPDDEEDAGMHWSIQLHRSSLATALISPTVIIEPILQKAWCYNRT